MARTKSSKTTGTRSARKTARKRAAPRGRTAKTPARKTAARPTQARRTPARETAAGRKATAPRTGTSRRNPAKQGRGTGTDAMGALGLLGTAPLGPATLAGAGEHSDRDRPGRGRMDSRANASERRSLADLGRMLADRLRRVGK